MKTSQDLLSKQVFGTTPKEKEVKQQTNNNEFFNQNFDDEVDKPEWDIQNDENVQIDVIKPINDQLQFKLKQMPDINKEDRSIAQILKISTHQQNTDLTVVYDKNNFVKLFSGNQLLKSFLVEFENSKLYVTDILLIQNELLILSQFELYSFNLNTFEVKQEKIYNHFSKQKYKYKNIVPLNDEFYIISTYQQELLICNFNNKQIIKTINVQFQIHYISSYENIIVVSNDKVSIQLFKISFNEFNDIRIETNSLSSQTFISQLSINSIYLFIGCVNGLIQMHNVNNLFQQSNLQQNDSIIKQCVTKITELQCFENKYLYFSDAEKGRIFDLQRFKILDCQSYLRGICSCFRQTSEKQIQLLIGGGQGDVRVYQVVYE